MRLAFVISGFLTLSVALAGAPRARAEEAPQQPLVFDQHTVGPPRSNDAAELFVPAGAGPFPAVVVLHGCNGISPHARNWVRRLVSWGYVAMVLDSFRPRGFENICNHGAEVPAREQSRDAFAAATYLRGLHSVIADRIGVLGFSHGAVAALLSAPEAAVEAAHAEPFRAVVAFYPGCGTHAPPLASDVAIFIGDTDEWTPAARCTALVARYAHVTEHRPTIKVYPGATHAFESRQPDRGYCGHLLRYDPAAAADSIAATHAFFDSRLMSPKRSALRQAIDRSGDAIAAEDVSNVRGTLCRRGHSGGVESRDYSIASPGGGRTSRRQAFNWLRAGDSTAREGYHDGECGSGDR